MLSPIDVFALLSLAFITTVVGIVGHDVYAVMKMNRLLAAPARSIRAHLWPRPRPRTSHRP
jgi:hypothetical protein